MSNACQAGFKSRKWLPKDEEEHCRNLRKLHCQYHHKSYHKCLGQVERHCPKPTSFSEEFQKKSSRCEQLASSRCAALMSVIENYTGCWKEEFEKCIRGVKSSRQSQSCHEVEKSLDVCWAPDQCQTVIFPVTICGP